MKEIKLYNGDETIFFDDSLDKKGKQKHAYWRLDPDDLKKDGNPKKKRIPGVTTILQQKNKPALINWAVETTIEYLRGHIDEITTDPYIILQKAKEEAERQKQEAADIGKDIHLWIEKHIKGEKPEIPAEENIKRGVISFLTWEDEVKPEYTESEKIVYSRQHNYVGTLDILARIDGKNFLLDLKTGNAIWEDHCFQTAAYLKADMEERKTPYEGRIILRVSKETEQEYLERVGDKAWFQKDPDKYCYKPFEAVSLDADGSNVEKDFAIFKAALAMHQYKKYI